MPRLFAAFLVSQDESEDVASVPGSLAARSAEPLSRARLSSTKSGSTAATINRTLRPAVVGCAVLLATATLNAEVASRFV
jgi:hypothetical protein